MAALLVAVTNFVREESGQDLIEYALLATLVAVAAMLAVGTMGSVMNEMWWQRIADAF